MYCIGLTGNIGSGKSSVAACFQALGIDVISADSIARALTAQDTPAYITIKAHFGPKAILPQGGLNRKYLRECIFKEEKERLWLEALLHPLIQKEILGQAQQSQSPYCIIEIPLLKRREDYPYLKRVLVIRASHALQLERIMARDQSSAEEAESILRVQPSSTKLETMADDIIWNDGSLLALAHAVKGLHEKYLKILSSAP